jgi:hypothetical protein
MMCSRSFREDNIKIAFCAVELLLFSQDSRTVGYKHQCYNICLSFQCYRKLKLTWKRKAFTLIWSKTNICDPKALSMVYVVDKNRKMDNSKLIWNPWGSDLFKLLISRKLWRTPLVFYDSCVVTCRKLLMCIYTVIKVCLILFD